MGHHASEKEHAFFTSREMSWIKKGRHSNFDCKYYEQMEKHAIRDYEDAHLGLLLPLLVEEHPSS